MLWSPQDFIREIRRQLVEIETLRKRVEASGELAERIERLAASHRRLLERLQAYFAERGEPAAEPGPVTVLLRLVRLLLDLYVGEEGDAQSLEDVLCEVALDGEDPNWLPLILGSIAGKKAGASTPPQGTPLSLQPAPLESGKGPPLSWSLASLN